MTRYQLAKLIEWAGVLKTRKRLQKVVYLLQANGCPLNAEYTLHHYGPYSSDVAQLADEMVRAGLLEEEETPNQARGQSFQYRLSTRARDKLAQLEQQQNNSRPLGQLGSFQTLAVQLLNEKDLQKLEYAATVVYFQRQGKSWEQARLAAAQFKGEKPDSKVMSAAESLARGILGPQEHN